MLVEGHRGVGLEQLPIDGAQDAHIVIGAFGETTEREKGKREVSELSSPHDLTVVLSGHQYLSLIPRLLPHLYSVPHVHTNPVTAASWNLPVPTSAPPPRTSLVYLSPTVPLCVHIPPNCAPPPGSVSGRPPVPSHQQRPQASSWTFLLFPL